MSQPVRFSERYLPLVAQRVTIEKMIEKSPQKVDEIRALFDSLKENIISFKKNTPSLTDSQARMVKEFEAKIQKTSSKIDDLMKGILPAPPLLRDSSPSSIEADQVTGTTSFDFIDFSSSDEFQGLTIEELMTQTIEYDQTLQEVPSLEITHPISSKIYILHNLYQKIFARDSDPSDIDDYKKSALEVVKQLFQSIDELKEDCYDPELLTLFNNLKNLIRGTYVKVLEKADEQKLPRLFQTLVKLTVELTQSRSWPIDAIRSRKALGEKLYEEAAAAIEQKSSLSSTNPEEYDIASLLGNQYAEFLLAIEQVETVNAVEQLDEHISLLQQLHDSLQTESSQESIGHARSEAEKHLNAIRDLMDHHKTPHKAIVDRVTFFEGLYLRFIEKADRLEQSNNLDAIHVNIQMLDSLTQELRSSQTLSKIDQLRLAANELLSATKAIAGTDPNMQKFLKYFENKHEMFFLKIKQVETVNAIKQLDEHISFLYQLHDSLQTESSQESISNARSEVEKHLNAIRDLMALHETPDRDILDRVNFFEGLYLRFIERADRLEQSNNLNTIQTNRQILDSLTQELRNAKTLSKIDRLRLAADKLLSATKALAGTDPSIQAVLQRFEEQYVQFLQHTYTHADFINEIEKTPNGIKTQTNLELAEIYTVIRNPSSDIDELKLTRDLLKDRIRIMESEKKSLSLLYVERNKEMAERFLNIVRKQLSQKESALPIEKRREAIKSLDSQNILKESEEAVLTFQLRFHDEPNLDLKQEIAKEATTFYKLLIEEQDPTTVMKIKAQWRPFYQNAPIKT